MSDAPTRDKTPEDRQLARIVAKSIWKIQNRSDMPEDADERNNRWQEEKTARIQEAFRIVRQMKRAGITIEAPQEEAQPSA